MSSESSTAASSTAESSTAESSTCSTSFTSLGQPSPGQPSPGQPSPGQPSLGQSSLGQSSLGQSSLGQPSPLSRPAHCLLVSHGSRDPRSALALENLRIAVQGMLPNSQIFTGVLELSDRSLQEQIRAIVATAPCETLTVLPLFLQPGRHVLEDLPAAIAQAQTPIRSLPYLGSAPALLTTLNALCPPTQTWIVAAHGSSHPATQTFFENLHATLRSHPAYWYQSPSLSETIHTLVAKGITEIGVLPYFLFPGKITDAMAQTLQPLKDQYTHVVFSDRPLLAEQPGFAALVAQLLCSVSVELRKAALDKI